MKKRKGSICRLLTLILIILLSLILFTGCSDNSAKKESAKVSARDRDRDRDKDKESEDDEDPDKNKEEEDDENPDEDKDKGNDDKDLDKDKDKDENKDKDKGNDDKDPVDVNDKEEDLKTDKDKEKDQTPAVYIPEVENSDTNSADNSSSKKNNSSQKNNSSESINNSTSDNNSSETSTNTNTSVPSGYQKIYCVINPSCNLRSQAAASSDKVKTINSTNDALYYYGEEAEGVGSDGQTYLWYKVTCQDGICGWIRSDLVIPAENPLCIYYLITAGKNIRIMPTHYSGLLTEITSTEVPMYYYGEHESGLGSDNNIHDWLKIYINDNEAGWIRGDFVTAG